MSPELPPEAQAAMAVAAERAEELAALGHELHFETNARTGRVRAQVRDLATGAVVCDAGLGSALAFLAGRA